MVYCLEKLHWDRTEALGCFWGAPAFGENDINGYLMSVHRALISELIEGWNNRRGLCDSGGLVGVISE